MAKEAAMERATVALAMVVILCGRVGAQDVSPIAWEGIVEAPIDTVWAAWTTSDCVHGSHRTPTSTCG